MPAPHPHPGLIPPSQLDPVPYTSQHCITEAGDLSGPNCGLALFPSAACSQLAPLSSPHYSGLPDSSLDQSDWLNAELVVSPLSSQGCPLTAGHHPALEHSRPQTPESTQCQLRARAPGPAHLPPASLLKQLSRRKCCGPLNAECSSRVPSAPTGFPWPGTGQNTPQGSVLPMPAGKDA